MAAHGDTATFPATLDACPNIITYILTAGQAAGMPAPHLSRLELAVEEAVVNICRYAYPASPGDLAVTMRADGGCFRVELSDTGIAFNPLDAGEPDTHAALGDRKIGGLGIYFIRKLIDDVQYQRVGDRNVLTLIMRIEQGGAPCSDSHGINSSSC